jgi:glycosyltransferase involved in cell wall biosynthesis
MNDTNTAPVRILHVVQRMEAGGTQSLLLNIYRNIDRTKVQFDFLVEYPEKQFYDDEIVSLGGQIFYSDVREKFTFKHFEDIFYQIINKYHYNVIHVHAYTIGYFVLKMAKKCGIPVRIAHAHNNNITLNRTYLPKLLMKSIYPKYATHLFACSEEAGKFFFGKRNFKVINNAIDAKKFVANVEVRQGIREELGMTNSFVVGHVGRFHIQKNPLFVLDIFNEILKNKPDAKLIMIGTGEMKDKILKKIDDLHLKDKVFLLGNRSDMYRIYQAMDVLIFPSVFEGLGIVAIEAQAAGIPTVCSDKLPPEANVSKLFRKVSLKDSAKVWAKVAIEESKNALAHTNTYQSIVEHNFDIHKVAEDLQYFYLNKGKNLL